MLLRNSSWLPSWLSGGSLWAGLAVGAMLLQWPAVSAGKSAACAKAEEEVAAARKALSKAIRAADAKAAAYHACVEKKGRSRCRREQKALRAAMKTKRDAQAAYRYAADKAKQVCSE